MKRIVLKKWVKVILYVIMLICILVMSSESDNDTVFYISKLFSLLVFILSSKLLLKYGGF